MQLMLDMFISYHYSTAILTFRYQAKDIKAEIPIVHSHIPRLRRKMAAAVLGAKHVSSTQEYKPAISVKLLYSYI